MPPGQSTKSEDPLNYSQSISLLLVGLTSGPGPRLHRISGDTQYIAEGLLWNEATHPVSILAQMRHMEPPRRDPCWDLPGTTLSPVRSR